MSDRIVTHHLSPYLAVQDTESNIEAMKAKLAADHISPVPHPMASFEDTTHAYECGYRDGLKAAQAFAPAVDPVAWMIEGYGPTENQKFAEKYSQARGKLVTPLYATPAAPAVKVATHRHVKRGTEYRLIGTGNVQTDTPLGDYTEVAIYQGAEGDLWVRPVGEFEDGRFELIGSALEGGAA